MQPSSLVKFHPEALIEPTSITWIVTLTKGGLLAVRTSEGSHVVRKSRAPSKDMQCISHQQCSSPFPSSGQTRTREYILSS